MGPNGRKCLVEAWSGYIPKYGDPPFQAQGNSGPGNGTLSNGSGGQMSNHTNGGSNGAAADQLVDEEEEER